VIVVPSFFQQELRSRHTVTKITKEIIKFLLGLIHLVVYEQDIRSVLIKVIINISNKGEDRMLRWNV